MKLDINLKNGDVAYFMDNDELSLIQSMAEENGKTEEAIALEVLCACILKHAPVGTITMIGKMAYAALKESAK